MAITLDPTPASLGISAPVLGPWFSTDVRLPTPDPAQRLSLRMSLPANTAWLPPATGTLSLFICDPGNPAPPIAHLQDADGNWPFSAGRLVAYFRLFPEIEARLDELMRLVPPVTGERSTSPPTTPFATSSRPRVRSFAISPALADVSHDSVVGLFGGSSGVPGSSDAERLTALGMALDGATVRNGAIAMTWLRRPGIFDPAIAESQQDVLLPGLSGEVEFWAFDNRGRPIDPGAVAAWWSWLLVDAVGDPAGGTAYQLLPNGVAATALPQEDGRRVVCRFVSGRTVHVTDAHEGPLAEPFMNGRLQAGGRAVDARLMAVSDSLAFSFSPLPVPATAPPPDNPVVDDAPLPRVAMLPSGTYQASVTLWPGGSPIIAGLERDFVRVAVVDEEHHLVGVRRRDSRETLENDGERRSAAQNRPSTRLAVGRTAAVNPVLLATATDVTAAMFEVFAATAPTRAVLGLADFAWGVTPQGLQAVAPAPASAPPAFPVVLPEDAGLAVGSYRVSALTGGGSADARQAIFVEVNLGPEHAGAWVRAWPLGFDLESGLRFRLTGGGGRVGVEGVARLVMTLPNGRIDAGGLLSMDLLVARLDQSGAIEQRGYADRRFGRPVPASGPPADASVFEATTAWVVCETGRTGTGALPDDAVPSGAVIVVTSTDPPSIVDRTTVGRSAWQPDTLGRALIAEDIVSLTQPAFRSTPDRADPLGRMISGASPEGNPLGNIDTATGVIVHRLDRSVSGAAASSRPLVLQDRLEVTAAAVASGDTPAALAVVGSCPALPWAHERSPGFLGHPGAPAAIEIHGTGAALSGAPALAVAEYTRERTAGLSFDFVRTASEPARSMAVQSELAVAAEASVAFPALAPASEPGPVVAVLRTGACGFEGMPGVPLAAATASLPSGGTTFPVSQNESALEGWLAGLSIPGASELTGALRGAVGTRVDAMTRALDRRILAGAFGCRESALALAAQFERAQDLVYIETPWLDAIAHGAGVDQLNLWQKLVTRMGERRGLQVVLCVPTLLGAGSPRMLQALRDSSLQDAIDAIKNVAVDRFAVFSPGAGAGRAVRFASTSVIVDDVFALTGTTHLSRRGLTFDSSLSVAVFDERTVDGRPREVHAFRRRLLADRLGISVERVPDDPAELARAVRTFAERGSVRLSVRPIERPETTPSTTDLDIWNPDGTRSDLTLSEVVALFARAVAQTDPEHAIVEG